MGSRNRPPPLRISKESQRIKKPPLLLPIVQHRRPVIIHTYSPNIIQTDPKSFMSLVQNLTGRCIEGGLDVQAKGHLLMDSVALRSPVSYASPAEGRKIDQTFTQIMPSPTSYLPGFVKAELVAFDEAFCLTPGPVNVRSPAAFTALASPRLWPPIPSPNNMCEQFFAELPSLSPRMQGPTDNLLSPFPVFSPRNKFGGMLPSPGTIAYKDLASKIIGDYF